MVRGGAAGAPAQGTKTVSPARALGCGAVAVAALLVAPRADACTCLGPADVVLPAFGVPAPRSTHVFVALAWEPYCVAETCVRGRSRFALSPVAPGGEAPADVDVTVRFFSNKARSVYELVPRTTLAPDTIHEVWWSDPDGKLRPRILGRFRTGREVDATPPVWAGVRSFSFVEPAQKPAAIQLCGPFGRRFSFAVQLGDDHAPEPWSPGTTLLGVWMGTDGSSHMNERAPDLLLLHDRGDWNREGWEVVSEDDDCSWNVVPLPPPGSRVHVGFRLFDTSGNASAGHEETYVAPKVPKGRARKLIGRPRWRSSSSEWEWVGRRGQARRARASARRLYRVGTDQTARRRLSRRARTTEKRGAARCRETKELATVMSPSPTSLPLSNRHVVIVLTSHDRKGSTGQPTGAYLSELSHPYAVLAEAGARVSFASVKGGRVPLDGVDRADPINAAFLDDADRMERLHASKRAGDVDPASVDAVFFAGGHGTMWDFPDDPGVAKLAAAVYERGGVVGAVCHGPAALVNARLSSGTYLVDGKDVAAFTDDEERAAGLGEVVPFFLASKLKERGAKHRPAPNWQANVVVSERLVTGQNPASAHGVAEAMVGVIKGL